MKYGAKVIYTYDVGGRRYYEESVLAINAGSFEEAYEKAEKYAAAYGDEHINPAGETVKTVRAKVLDCFLALDEEDGVQEIYSAIMKNKSSLDEDAFYAAITDLCEADEMHDLRYREFN